MAPQRLGRYQLIKKIAVGGMAEIYLARVSGVGGFEKNVVLKRILPQLAESDEFFRMFLDEARIAATLQHPNVIQVYDAGHEAGEYFIAMEYLEGADLLTIQRILSDQNGRMPLENAIHVASSVAAGLHYAHEKDIDGEPLGIVHRDVTPHNVFLTRDGGVKLVDFGIAKATNRLSSTSYGTLKGKLAYMSPEQCRGEAVDRRSDIYSLGIVLYEMATGARLYRGQSEYLVLKEIVEGVVAPPSRHIAGFPVSLDRIIMRALEKEPDRRYASARDMAKDLTDFARTQQLATTPIAIAEWLEPILGATREKARARRPERGSTIPTTGSRRVETHNQERGYVSPDVGHVDEEELGTGVDRLLAELGVVAASAPPAPARDADTALPVADERQDRWEETPPPERPPRAPTPAPRAPTPPPRAPTPEADVASLALDDLEEPNLRRGNSALWLGACLVVAMAAAAVWVLLLRDQEPAVAPAEPPAPEGPVIGTAVVESDPSGADAWLLLGRAPVESFPIDVGAVRELLVEHDGYVARRVPIGPGAWTLEDEVPVARLSIELAPHDAKRGADPGVEAGAGTDEFGGPVGFADGALGRIMVETDPPAARVWIGVGITPTTVSGIPIDRSYEFRLDRAGFAPAFVRFGRADFGERRRAHVRAGMKSLDCSGSCSPAVQSKETSPPMRR